MSEDDKNDRWRVEWSDLAEKIGETKTKIVEEIARKKHAEHTLQTINQRLELLRTEFDTLIDKAQKYLH
ncbi:hypothetical protein LCGC14_1614800 [marine sediment metagenome]|uniref:Uncharacterized protein n=1 Tax=marine sediment metagenome TaxID=412755 RepID=A0A0F9KMS0_9ZZZZ